MQTLIHSLEQHLQSVPAQLQKISMELLAHKPKPNKWSKKEILGHLVDSAQNNLRRFIEIQFSLEAYQIIGYSQDDLVRINGYQEMPIQEIVQLWLTLNRQIARVWKTLPLEKLPSKVLNTDGTESTLEWWVVDYIRHLEHHLQQIFEGVNTSIQTPQNTSKETFIRENFQIGVAEAMAKLKARKDGQFFLETLEHGSMNVEIYQPQKIDLQQPHKQDELYVVYSGSGIFYNDGVRHPFKTGDVLFAPAGVAHRFEDFTEDFITWVIFYGPQGGEVQNPVHQAFIAEKGAYQISTNDARLDTEYVFSYLSKESYWAKNIPKAIFENSLQNSLNFGLYHQEQQIGFARVITDSSTFAYLADVFVEEGFRGQGLALWLTETIKAYEGFRNIKRWMLMTHSAQELYEKAGFRIAAYPERVMELVKPNPYG